LEYLKKNNARVGLTFPALTCHGQLVNRLRGAEDKKWNRAKPLRSRLA